MTTANDLGPLDWRIAITDGNGRPTPEFQRRWNTQRNNNGLIGVTIGTGAPTSIPSADGLEYLDKSATPPALYVSVGGQWTKVGVYKFTQLSDVPNTYSGASLKLVQVNNAATALQFNSLSSVLDTLGSTWGDLLYRGTSGWTVLTPGTSGQVLTTQGTGANPIWTEASGGGLPQNCGFNATGLLSAGEELAVWAFPTAITFDDTNLDTFFLAGFAPTSNAVLDLVVGGVAVGTITYLASATTATLSFTSNPYTLAAKTEMRLLAPATADPTLADIYGEIVGHQ